MVAGEVRLEALRGHLEFVGHATRIVDQQMDPIRQIANPLGQPRRIRQRRQVGIQHGHIHVAGLRPDLRFRRRHTLRIATRTDNPPALASERFRNLLADARTGTGDNGHAGIVCWHIRYLSSCESAPEPGTDPYFVSKFRGQVAS